jgi:hypothetical protein
MLYSQLNSEKVMFTKNLSFFALFNAASLNFFALFLPLQGHTSKICCCTRSHTFAPNEERKRGQEAQTTSLIASNGRPHVCVGRSRRLQAHMQQKNVRQTGHRCHRTATAAVLRNQTCIACADLNLHLLCNSTPTTHPEKIKVGEFSCTLCAVILHKRFGSAPRCSVQRRCKPKR